MPHTMDEDIFTKMDSIAERVFGMANDPDQIPVSQETDDKLLKLHPKSFVFKEENGEPISWVVVVPTSIELANRFLGGEITEREMFALSEPQKEYGALYLCSAITVPEKQRRGYAVELFKEAIAGIPHVVDVKIFAWPISEKGELLLQRLEKELAITIERKK